MQILILQQDTRTIDAEFVGFIRIALHFISTKSHNDLPMSIKLYFPDKIKRVNLFRVSDNAPDE